MRTQLLFSNPTNWKVASQGRLSLPRLHGAGVVQSLSIPAILISSLNGVRGL